MPLRKAYPATCWLVIDTELSSMDPFRIEFAIFQDGGDRAVGASQTARRSCTRVQRDVCRVVVQRMTCDAMIAASSPVPGCRRVGLTPARVAVRSPVAGSHTWVVPSIT